MKDRNKNNTLINNLINHSIVDSNSNIVNRKIIHNPNTINETTPMTGALPFITLNITRIMGSQQYLCPRATMIREINFRR